MKPTSQRTRCPTCGHPGLLRVARDVTTRLGRKTLVVPGIELDECVHCGERLYDLAALRRIHDVRRASRRSRAA